MFSREIEPKSSAEESKTENKSEELKQEFTPEDVACDLEEVKAIGKSERVAAGWVCPAPEIENYARNHNLDVRRVIPRKDSPDSYFIIAEKRKIGEALEEKISNFDAPLPLKKKLLILFEKIKDLSLVDGVNFTGFYRFDEKKNLESPESNIILGLAFGFKPCCIKYYIDTRNFGRKKYPNEKLYFGGQVHCKECAKKLAKEWGDKDIKI